MAVAEKVAPPLDGGLSDAASRIQSMLNLDPAPEQPKTETQAPETPPETPETPEIPEQPTPQVEGDEAPADEQKVAEIPLDQLEAIQLEVTTKSEGGENIVEKPTIKELREGYMRQKDYSRKTAEVARQREELGEKTRQAIESERSQYQKNLQELQTVLLETVAPELKDVNWNNLAANDPFEYVKLRNRADQIQQALSTIQSKQKELTAKQEADLKATQLERARKAREELERDIPNWSDSLYQTLMKSGQGYKPEEVATWVDPRAIKLLHKAYLYDQLKTGSPEGKKTPPAPPKVTKPGSAQTPPAQQKQADAMKRLRSSGRIEDAADVIRSRLGA